MALSTDYDPNPPSSVGIANPHPHDVLSGRGGASNNHPGNAVYRTIIEKNKAFYKAAPKGTRSSYAVAIVDAVSSQDPPGRFLQLNKDDKLWYEVGRRAAINKAAQALREKKHKAREVPVDEIPVEFHHLLNLNGVAAIGRHDVDSRGSDQAQISAGKKRKGGAAGGAAAAAGSSDALSVSDHASASRESEPGKKTKKKPRLDPRFFFSDQRTSSNAFSERSSVPGSEMSDNPHSPTAWTSRFASIRKLGLGRGGAEPTAVEAPRLKSDPTICVETALESGPSLFNFFSSLGTSLRHLDTTVAADDQDEGKVSAATDGSDLDQGRTTSGAEHSRSPSVMSTSSAENRGGGTKRRGVRTAATAAARAAVEAEPPVRTTTLTSDISSFLPSFLERGATAILDHIHGGSGSGSEPEPQPNPAQAPAVVDEGKGAPATTTEEPAPLSPLFGAPSLGMVTSLGRGLSTFLGSWLSGSSTSSGGAVTERSGATGMTATATDGLSSLGPPRPPALKEKDRVLTLMRDDDDDEEDPAIARLRAFPQPPMPGAGMGT